MLHYTKQSIGMMLCLLPLMALAMDKVTLWNSGTCPYAQRAWIALKEKGVDFDYKQVDLKDKDATPDFGAAYYKANPNKMSSSKVPVMLVESADGDTKYYTESKVLLEVIEEMFPDGPRLLPDSLDERYRARVFGDAVYDSIWGGDRSPYKMVGRKANGEGWDRDKEEEAMCQMLEALDESLQHFDSEGPFVCGNHFSMAECITAPFVQRADFMLDNYLEMNVAQLCRKRGYARAGAWWKAVLDRPSVKETATPDPNASIQRVIDMMSKAAATK